MNMDDVCTAKKRLLPYIDTTPLIFSHPLERLLNKKVWLKLETQLPTGSFKPRPAFNSILKQFKAAKEYGVIASSSGNFAQGVAYAAKVLGLSAIIVMSENTSPYKIMRTKKLGAEVILCGNSHTERENTLHKLQLKTQRVLLHPYDSLDTIEGDATIGLELIEQFDFELNNVTILVPVSGGGLIAGIAFAIKTLYPSCQMIGVQPAVNGSLAESFKVGKCIGVDTHVSIADALTAPLLGSQPFEYIKKYVDKVILVDEENIQKATHYLIEDHKLVVEPGGAIGVAALLSGQVTSSHCVCIISGGNINLWND